MEIEVVLISGASSRIGGVAIFGRNEWGLNEVIEEIQKSGAPIPFAMIAYNDSLHFKKMVCFTEKCRSFGVR